MMGNALHHYPASGLGLIAGSQEKISTWGLLGFAMMSQKTLGEALRIANTYYYTGPALIDLEIHAEGPEFYFRAYAPYPIASCLPMAIEEVGTCIQAMFAIMIGRPVRFTEIQVGYD